MPILRYLRKNLNAKRFSEYVSNHLSTLKINKKITALLKCGYKLRSFTHSFYNNDGATPSNFRV